jgi:hypothetical protein
MAEKDGCMDTQHSLSPALDDFPGARGSRCGDKITFSPSRHLYFCHALFQERIVSCISLEAKRLHLTQAGSDGLQLPSADIV